MARLLAKVRALPDSLQNLVVLGTLIGVIAIVVLMFTVLG
jgi:hypothetical protein